jgi:hypothetical protein
MSPVNVTSTHDQHVDSSWRVSGPVVPSALVLAPQGGCALTTGPTTGVAYVIAAVTPVRDRKAVRGMSTDGAFAGTRAWSPPS